MQKADKPRPPGRVILPGAPSAEMVATVTPYMLIHDNVAERTMPGFTALFCRLFLVRLNDHYEGAFLDQFTDWPYRIPKEEVHELMRGRGSEEARHVIKLANRMGDAKDFNALASLKVLSLMATCRWREAALHLHGLFFWFKTGGPIENTDYSEMLPEHRELHDLVTQVAVDTTLKIFGAPSQALRLIYLNPHYMRHM